MIDLRPIASDPRVRRLRVGIRQRDARTLLEQARIVAIPAPAGLEGARATFIADRFHEIGLKGVHRDEVGNVIGVHSGSPDPSRLDGAILVASHLDTIFPEGTSVELRREGKRYLAPGISDNSRGLAASLAIADILHEQGVATARPVVFIATVGEEGLGDLRGVKHLFRAGSPYRSAAAFIALDGPGLDRIVHRAIGSLRLRVTIEGPGGHSWGDRGVANPVHALGEAIALLRELRDVGGHEVAVNVGRIGGGTSVNAIPQDGWLEVDLRSENPTALAGLEAEVARLFEAGIAREQTSASRHGPLRLRIERIGQRPAGETPTSSPLVEAAISATALLGGVPELTSSSTDANVPIALGIPAIAIGAGGQGGRTHTLDEWFENDDGHAGIERAVLVILTMAGLAGTGQEPEPTLTIEWSPTST